MVTAIRADIIGTAVIGVHQVGGVIIAAIVAVGFIMNRYRHRRRRVIGATTRTGAKGRHRVTGMTVLREDGVKVRLRAVGKHRIFVKKQEF